MICVISPHSAANTTAKPAPATRHNDGGGWQELAGRVRTVPVVLAEASHQQPRRSGEQDGYHRIHHPVGHHS